MVLAILSDEFVSLVAGSSPCGGTESATGTSSRSVRLLSKIPPRVLPTPVVKEIN